MSRATDIRYGRRGGRWVDHQPGQLLAELRQLRAQRQAPGPATPVVDHTGLFHPDAIAVARAHRAQCPRPHKPGEDCPALPDPDDVTAVWAGRARMARARQAAGQPLDAVDLEALGRAEP